MISFISSLCMYFVCMIVGALTIQVLRNMVFRLSTTAVVVFHIICVFTVPGLYTWIQSVADFTNMADVVFGGVICGYMGNVLIYTVVYIIQICKIFRLF